LASSIAWKDCFIAEMLDENLAEVMIAFFLVDTRSENAIISPGDTLGQTTIRPPGSNDNHSCLYKIGFRVNNTNYNFHYVFLRDG
jgi:hypothetical protein